MKRAKRGQVTVFIIIGVILLFLGLVFVYISEKEDSQTSFPEVDLVQTHIQSCIDALAADAVILFGISLSLHFKQCLFFVPYL